MVTHEPSPYLDALIEISADLTTLEAVRDYESTRLKAAFDTLDTELNNAPDVCPLWVRQSTPMGDEISDSLPAIKRTYETEQGSLELIAGRFYHVPKQGNFRSPRHITFVIGLPNQPSKRMFTLTEDGFTGTDDHASVDLTEELVATFIALRQPV